MGFMFGMVAGALLAPRRGRVSSDDSVREATLKGIKAMADVGDPAAQLRTAFLYEDGYYNEPDKETQKYIYLERAFKDWSALEESLKHFPYTDTWSKSDRDVLTNRRDEFKKWVSIKQFEFGKEERLQNNLEEAKDWFRKSGELGNSNGWCALGMLEHDDNPDQALEAFRIAAEQGNKAAIHNFETLSHLSSHCYDHSNLAGVIGMPVFDDCAGFSDSVLNNVIGMPPLNS